MNEDQITSASQRLKQEQSKPDFDSILGEIQKATDETRKATVESYRINEEDRAQGLKQQSNASLALQASTGERASIRGQAEEQRTSQFAERELNVIRAQRDQSVANLNQSSLNSAINMYGQESAQYNQNLRLGAQLEAPREQQSAERGDAAKIGALANQMQQQGATNAYEASSLLQGLLSPEQLSPYFQQAVQYETKQVGDQLVAYNPNDPKDSYVVHGAQGSSGGSTGVSAGGSGSSYGGSSIYGGGSQPAGSPLDSSFSNALNYAPVQDPQAMEGDLTRLIADGTSVSELTRARGEAERMTQEALSYGIKDPVSAYMVSRTGVPKTTSSAQLFDAARTMVAQFSSTEKGHKKRVNDVTGNFSGIIDTLNQDGATPSEVSTASNRAYKDTINNSGDLFSLSVAGDTVTVKEAYGEYKDVYMGMNKVIDTFRQYRGEKDSVILAEVTKAINANMGWSFGVTPGSYGAGQAAAQLRLEALNNIKGVPSDKDAETVAETLITQFTPSQGIDEFEKQMEASAMISFNKINTAMGLQGKVDMFVTSPSRAFMKDAFRFKVTGASSPLDLPQVQQSAGNPITETPTGFDFTGGNSRTKQ